MLALPARLRVEILISGLDRRQMCWLLAATVLRTMPPPVPLGEMLQMVLEMSNSAVARARMDILGQEQISAAVVVHRQELLLRELPRQVRAGRPRRVEEATAATDSVQQAQPVRGAQAQHPAVVVVVDSGTLAVLPTAAMARTAKCASPTFAHQLKLSRRVVAGLFQPASPRSRLKLGAVAVRAVELPPVTEKAPVVLGVNTRLRVYP